MPRGMLSLRFQLIFAHHLHFNFAQALALLASATGFWLQSPLAWTSSSQGRPTVVVPSFISTFAPSTPSLVSSRACSVAAFSPQSVVLTLSAANPAPILHQPFVVAPGFSPIRQKSSHRLCPENLWSLTSFCLPTLCLRSQNHSCCSMGA